MRDPKHEHEHDAPHDQGLRHDLEVLNGLANRRRVLGWIAAASAATILPLLGCSGSSSSSGDDSSGEPGGTGAGGTTTTLGGGDGGASASGSSTTECTTIPEETAGPYPGDGTNGPNALTESGIVRADITTSFGTLSGTAQGVPLTVTLQIVSASGSCESLSGYAVYIWHCDRDGNYSMYTAADQNYLRGVQETDSSGTVTFTSIYPACYSGRWPHVHFEVYKSVADATAAGTPIATSQLAMPDAQNKLVFATTGYEASVANYARISLATDMVFSDGARTETPTVTGSVAAGFAASLSVGVG